MTEFKVGDRVRLSAKASAYRRGKVGNSEGTVKPDDGFSQFEHVTVDWDNGSLENFPLISEIELVPEEASEPVIVDSELRERLIEQAIKSSDFGVVTETIIARARAFEAYITGDTK